MTGRFVTFDFISVSPYSPSDPHTLRELSAQLMGRVDPVPLNTLDWLETFNNRDADSPLGIATYLYCVWHSTAGFVPRQGLMYFDPARIAPDRRLANTLRDVVAYLAPLYGIADNSVEQLAAVNHVTPDQQLPTPGGSIVLTCWTWEFATAGSSSVPPQRYLRMSQRDDGLGVTRHPRLHVAGANNPSSAQSGRPPRLGTTNRYH